MESQITILAPGLLGASVGQAAYERRLAGTIAAWGRRAETLADLKKEPWCRIVAATAEEAVSSASLVVICAPVEKIASLVERIAPFLANGAIVTDVGSVKEEICRSAHAAMPPGRHFVGSHPMAGSEKSGMANARADLFEGRSCFVTPLEKTDPAAVARVAAFWTALGAGVTTVSPSAHDEIVAHISHLPHVLASALCSFLARRDPAWLRFAGGGFRDTTRIAAGSPELWRDILRQNRDRAIAALRGFQQELAALEDAIEKEDFAKVSEVLHRGKNYRDMLRS